MYRITIGFRSGLRCVLLISSISIATLTIPVIPAWAQTAPEMVEAARYSACQPPAANEYLLLVVSPTQQVQTQVKQVLPGNTDAIVCNYQNEVVTRVSGFSSIEAANSWAKYLTEMSGLQAFVAKPAVTQAATPQPSSLVTPSENSGYNPRPLGEGYAVLVNYLNKPEMATQIRQLLGQEVGLVSYDQRPYLLANHAPTEQAANSIMQTLNDRGFSTIVVDGRQVVLLREAVSGQ